MTWANGWKSRYSTKFEIKLKYDLIRVVEDNGIAKFDGGGKFLESHNIASYTSWLGSNEDDYRNTLTGRMLMLLESKVLVGKELYDEAISEVIKEYFRDFSGHEYDFMPAFLFNDILRMWRTFAVNYEFHRKGDSRNKIKNLKLKFSRMITCYSAVVFLLAVHAKHGTVRPPDVEMMISISPTERLEEIAKEGFWEGEFIPAGLVEMVDSALSGYSIFLELTHQDIKKSVRAYQADEEGWRARSYNFGQCLSSLIDLIGDVSEPARRLRRLILI